MVVEPPPNGAAAELTRYSDVPSSPVRSTSTSSRSAGAMTSASAVGHARGAVEQPPVGSDQQQPVVLDGHRGIG